MSVTFEMDFNLRVVDRNLFTVLDLLSDIGGLSQTFLSLASSIVAVWHYDGILDAYMSKRLFRLS